ncbi:MAG TPA: hypothetical protein PKW59_12450 [Thermotogota bacterium]|nr:hypothetical protein [Thermotogota bacterium]
MNISDTLPLRIARFKGSLLICDSAIVQGPCKFLGEKFSMKDHLLESSLVTLKEKNSSSALFVTSL